MLHVQRNVYDKWCYTHFNTKWNMPLICIHHKEDLKEYFEEQLFYDCPYDVIRNETMFTYVIPLIPYKYCYIKMPWEIITACPDMLHICYDYVMCEVIANIPCCAYGAIFVDPVEQKITWCSEYGNPEEHAVLSNTHVKIHVYIQKVIRKDNHWIRYSPAKTSCWRCNCRFSP